MEIKLLDTDKEKMKTSFLLKGASPAYANTLRRMILDEVPTMAIEDVELRKNSTILYDEVIAHRLGLIPLKTDLKSYNLKKECSCKGEGCAQCELKLTFKAKGPCVAYASELKSTDPKVVPVHPKTIIAKLLKGQEIELEATAILGTGKEHAKWTPGWVYYNKKPVVEIKGEIKDATELKTKFPSDLFETKGNKVTINKDALIKYDFTDAEELKPYISVTEMDDEFIFYIESWGQLSCNEILTKAVERLQGKLDLFIESVKKLK